MENILESKWNEAKGLRKKKIRTEKIISLITPPNNVFLDTLILMSPKNKIFKSDYSAYDACRSMGKENTCEHSRV